LIKNATGKRKDILAGKKCCNVGSGCQAMAAAFLLGYGNEQYWRRAS